MPLDHHPRVQDACMNHDIYLLPSCYMDKIVRSVVNLSNLHLSMARTLLSTVFVPPIESPKAKISSSRLNSSVKVNRKMKERRGMVKMGLDFSMFGNLGCFRGGSGVLERPSFDQSQNAPSPQAEAGGDIGRFRDKKATGWGDSYRVLLIDDPRHTEDLVERTLPQVVPSLPPEDARKRFHESRQNGLAIVIVAVKEHAEFYCEMMTRKGLKSAIENDTNTN